MGAGDPDSPPPQPLRAPDLRDLRVADDVYEPAEDSFALVDALALALAAATAANTLPRVALEVGCGSGFVSAAVAAALSDPKSAYAVEGARVYATDCNPAACAATRALLAAHAPAAAADVRECDLEGALATELRGAVDLLVFNPPYVPSPEDEVGGPRIEAAWAGGERGRVVIDRLLPRVANLLSGENGCARRAEGEEVPPSTFPATHARKCRPIQPGGH